MVPLHPPRNTKLLILGVIVLAVLVMVACSAGGKRAPDFKITVYQSADVLGGKEVMFSDLLAKGKPVVLNFWAGQCPPCRAEMPDLQAVSEEYQDRILLFGLDVGPFVGLGSREDGQALLKELGVIYPAGTTFDAQVVKAYNVLGMPTTFFIKPDGEIVEQWTALISRPKLKERVESLLVASGGAKKP